MGLSIRNIYWIAGFLEGEGSFGLVDKKYPLISAGQKQKYPLEKLKILLRHGHITKGDIWRYGLSHFRAIGVMMTIYNLMSPKRQEQIKKVILRWKQLPGLGSYNRNKTHCKYGHLYTPETTYFDTSKSNKSKRKCAVCLNMRRYKGGTIRKYGKYYGSQNSQRGY